MFLFFSHRLELLVERLAKEILQTSLGVFDTPIIVVPNSNLKQWLLIRLANLMPQQGIAGCKIIPLTEALPTSRFTEIFCTLYKKLENSAVPEIESYLASSPNRITELAGHLATLFLRYAMFSLPEHEPNWQTELFHSLSFKNLKSQDPVHLFGFDFLPDPIWKSIPFAGVYLFSPCRHFWADLATNRQRKHIWKKRGSLELEGYLQDAPPLLANWGKTGRETLKILEQFDWEMDENYAEEAQSNTTLARLKTRLLDFVVEKGDGLPADSSIQIVKAGNSILKELEVLRKSILELMDKENLSFSDIGVYVPDMRGYSSLIQFVFADLPHRIFDLPIGSKSFFYQGLCQFFGLNKIDELGPLFENPSFHQKRGWSAETIYEMQELLTSDQEKVAYGAVFFSNEKMKGENEFLEIYESLKNDLALLKTPRTLTDWANLLLELSHKYFYIDHSDETEAQAWDFFQQILKELLFFGGDDLFPFEPIHTLLKRSPPVGAFHAAHLHGIRFAPLECGEIIPAKAIFCIGMDEEKFPRKLKASSLDLLQKGGIFTNDEPNQDRYLFLQILFAAKDFLYISYPHLANDGNPVNPSPLIEELVASLDAPAKESTVSALRPSEAPLFVPQKNSQILEETISISELTSLARHPWEFYLKKELGIRFEKPEEFSFMKERARLSKKSLDKQVTYPKGICGEALKGEVEKIAKDWKGHIASWNLQIERASFLQSCREKKQDECGWEFPALHLDGVKIVGEMKQFSTLGYIHTGYDNLEGLLKVWPECLAALIASESTKIYFLKTGKVKEIGDPKKALSAFIRYYFKAKSTPSPLLPTCADAFLRKGFTEWEKKMQTTLLGKTHFEDEVMDWVMERISFPTPKTWYDDWHEELSTTFDALLDLYGGKVAAV